MLNLDGSFSGFMGALFEFINTLLISVFGWLTDLISGISIDIL